MPSQWRNKHMDICLAIGSDAGVVESTFKLSKFVFLLILYQYLKETKGCAFSRSHFWVRKSNWSCNVSMQQEALFRIPLHRLERYMLVSRFHMRAKSPLCYLIQNLLLVLCFVFVLDSQLLCFFCSASSVPVKVVLLLWSRASKWRRHSYSP